MYRGYLNRRRDSREHAPPTGSVSSSSQSSDPTAQAAACRPTSTSPKNRFFPISLAPAPRSSSLTRMGQPVSRSEPAAPHSPVLAPAPVPSPPPTVTRLKRAWPVSRRKKSEDVTSIVGRAERSSGDSSERGRGTSPSVVSSTFTTPASTPAASVDDLQISASPPPFEQRQPRPPKSPKYSGSPPILPPKPAHFQVSKPPPSPTGAPSDGLLHADAAISPLSSPTAPDGNPTETTAPTPREKVDRDLKQDWRKSDATTMSYVTIRPGTSVGSRSPRPVSLAESSHSGHTIVPVNKRLSALITDAEFVMAEEGDSDTEPDILRIPISGRPSPTNSVKARNRRSASLNLGPGHWNKLASLEHTTATSSQPSNLTLSRTFTDTRPSPTPSKDQPTLSKTAARGFIAPIATSGAPPPASSSFRSRLAAWAAFEKPPAPMPPPPQHPRRGALSPPPQNTSFRQTAVSMTGALAPVALGFGRRAAEKVHRVWDGLSASSSNSAFSSTSSLSVSLHSHNSGQGMDRSVSGHSGNNAVYASGGWKKNRRTPNAPSGAYSVSSSITNLSDADSVASSVGRCLREPQRNRVGMPTTGLVFGRDLQACVADTAIDSLKEKAGSRDPNEPPFARRLEDRALPAIVVRCAQHILRWGVHEEGLFRMSGRAGHTNRLRAAFDSGADYDLVECGPGDLDPHSVSVVLKAYLRELPQSILTNALSSLFESVVGIDPKDSEANLGDADALAKLRKPPSMSTFKIVGASNMKDASNDIRIALASLIARMPEENRDLLYTVVELIKATAASSEATKMPINNQVILFSPSLKMSPRLLIALCEIPDIWEGPNKLMDSLQNASHDSPESQGDLELNRKTLHAPDLGELANSPYRLSNNSSGQDDAASYMSALDHPTSPSDGSSSHLPALTTSTDSIATPSTMSEVSSLKPQSLASGDETCEEKSSIPTRVVPTIATNDLSLPPQPRRPFISSPIPFPSSGEPSPRSPIARRKSLTLLSFPQRGRGENSQDSSSSTWAHRPKRPSLTMLFSRKSASPICSPSISISSPQPPPVIDTPISSSPIHMFDPSRNGSQAKVTVTDYSEDSPAGSNRGRRDSFASSLFSTPQQTPVAALHRSRSPSPSVRALTPEGIPPRPPSAARNSPVPSIDINLEHDDWAESVLKATSASDEPHSPLSVKDAVRLFEGR